MKILKKILVIGISATIILIIVLAVRASANADITSQDIPHKGQNNTAVMQAIQNNDYNSWYALMAENGKNPKILEYINETNFSKFSEMHEYLRKAEEIRTELGLPKGPMGRNGFGGNCGMSGMFSKNNAVFSALENNDYNAFVTALESDARASKMFSFVTQDNFLRFAEMHNLVKAGDKEGAKTIADELGLPGPQIGIMKRGFGKWKGRLDEGRPENAVNQN